MLLNGMVKVYDSVDSANLFCFKIPIKGQFKRVFCIFLDSDKAVVIIFICNQNLRVSPRRGSGQWNKLFWIVKIEYAAAVPLTS